MSVTSIITSKAILTILANKFKKRGILFLSNEKDIELFFNYLDENDVDNFPILYKEGVLFTKAFFYPPYIDNLEFTPLNCYSMN